MHKAGYKYISTDVTQAFYLTQNNLWEGLFPGCVRECLESIENLDEIGAEEIVHVPYWEMWDLRNADLEADIMVANHCLTEMAENSLRFYLQYGKRLMRNSKYKLLIAQNPGSLRFRSLEYLIKTFDIMGYALLYSYGDYLVFCLKDKEGIIPANMKKVLKAIRHRSTEIPKYENALDQTARLIISGKQKIQDMPKVSLKEIEEFFRSIDKKIDSPDEEFVHYIGYQII